MRCDYQRATFWGENIFHEGEIKALFPVRLLQIQNHLGGEWKHNKKTLNGYQMRFDLVRDDEVLCYALSDGSGDAAGSHQIESVGHTAAEVRTVLDLVFDQRYATARRDTCFDFMDDDDYTQFHALAAIAREMATARKMSYDQVGQGWLVKGETMTIYLGSRNSPVFIRIYLRGLKTIKEGGVDDPRRVRVEIEVKPGKKASKESLTLLNDAELFGCSKWSKEFIEKAGIHGIDRHIVGTVWKLSDEQRSFAHLIKQYGPLLEKILDRRGALGLEKMIRDQIKVPQHVRDSLRSIEIEKEVAEW